MYKSIMVFLLAALVMTSEAQAAGNEWNDSFSKAKKTLERQVYYDHRITLYCGAAFDEKKDVAPPEGFTAPKHEKRAGKIEWEHVVPAENFGRAFPEWREGDAQCVDKRGKAFRGRKCAERVNREYRLSLLTSIRRLVGSSSTTRTRGFSYSVSISRGSITAYPGEAAPALRHNRKNRSPAVVFPSEQMEGKPSTA